MDFRSNMPNILVPARKEEKKQDEYIVCWNIFLAFSRQRLPELKFAYQLTFLPSNEFPLLFLLLIFSPFSVTVQTHAKYLKLNIICPMILSKTMSLYCSNSKIVAAILGVKF